jgi:hypothetical protein
MAETNELLLDKLKELLKQKKSNGFYAGKLNVPIGTIYDLREKLKEKKSEKPDNEEFSEDRKTEEYKADGTATFEYKGNKSIQSLEDAIKFFNIDTTKWDIERWVCNSYDVSSKWRKQNLKWDNGVMYGTAVRKNEWITHTNYQVKVWLKKKQGFSPDSLLTFLETYKPSPIQVLSVRMINSDKEFVDAEISLADFHLDRKVLAGDSIEDRKKEYKKVLDGLLDKITSCYNINKLVFVIGNDFFNTDNYHNQTTNLTPQEITTSWDKAYEHGFDLLVESITKTSRIANHVEVVLIQGNHDRTKSFYLAHALEVFFKSTKNVSFLRENSNTKFVVLGKTFIGYHHGNHIKIDNLPLYFQNDEKSSIAYGVAKYREIHTGDKHHYMAKDVQGVRIQQIPSMVKPDNYTNDGLYLHVKAGLALCYHPVHGKCAEFEQRL